MRIRQVLTNLVENALKYCPSQSRIRITVRKSSDPDPTAYFFIENPSEPLSNEALKNVWSNFFRTDPSRKEPGTGLGLAIVKSIIDLHGGTCTVRNTGIFEGQMWKTGVEFGFTLPLH
ncbi:MAG: sensor histidine kinase [Oscillospiraceae bacterium]|nr:sensor histidine kinase [Oscillospiraceae bacterium]